MADKGITQSQADQFFTTQAASSETAYKISGQAGLTSDDFWIQPDSGNLVGYYSNVSQKDLLNQYSVSAVSVPESALSLSNKLNSMLDKIPENTPGLFSSNINVKDGVIEVHGTAAFFASQAWSSAASGAPWRAIVDSEQFAPRLSTGTAIPGNYSTTPSTPGFVSQCSIGWVTQQNNVMTAGHCAYDPPSITSLGRVVSDGGGNPIGVTSSSLYKNNGYDWGKISLYSGVGAQGSGYYANYNGGKNRILAVRPVITDEYVCKYGWKTGVTCGTVVSSLGSMTYNGVTVRNIARAAMCNERGDSASPIVAPDTPSTSRGIAKGVLSGTNGSCSIGKLTYFSRLPDLLSYYHNTLNTEIP